MSRLRYVAFGDLDLVATSSTYKTIISQPGIQLDQWRTKHPPQPPQRGGGGGHGKQGP